MQFIVFYLYFWKKKTKKNHSQHPAFATNGKHLDDKFSNVIFQFYSQQGEQKSESDEEEKQAAFL